MTGLTEKRRVRMYDFDGNFTLSKNPHTTFECFLLSSQTVSAITTKDGESLARILSTCDEDFLPEIFWRCKANEWSEGVLLFEREIACRGLHINDPKERFEL